MPVYFVAEAQVTNPELMKEYAAKAGPTISAHGGKVLIATGDITYKDGDWQPKRLVVLEFETEEKANAWYDSPEYQDIVDMRIDATRGGLVMVGGLG